MTGIKGIMKKTEKLLLALFMAFACIQLFGGTAAHAEATPVITVTPTSAYSEETSKYTVTLAVSAKEGYSVKAVIFNGDSSKTAAPFEYTVAEAKSYDYSVVYTSADAPDTELTFTGSYEVPAHVTVTPLTWKIPNDAVLQWAVTETNEADTMDLVAVLELTVTDKDGKTVVPTVVSKGGLNTAVAGDYNVTFKAANPENSEDETKIYTIHVATAAEGVAPIEDPLPQGEASSSVTIKWTSATVGLGTTADPVSTDTDLTIKPSDQSNKGLQATVSINIMKHYNAGEFSFTLPGGLGLYQTSTQMAELQVAGLPIPLAPNTGSSGWQYSVLDNGDIKIVNTIEKNPETQAYVFSVTYAVNDISNVKDLSSVTLQAGNLPTAQETVISNGAKVTFDTFTTLKSATKEDGKELYKFPELKEGQTTFYGLAENEFDFTNYLYMTYKVTATISGTQKGTLVIDESVTGTLQGSGDTIDKIAAVCTNVYGTEQAGTWNPTEKTYTLDVAGAGDQVVYILVAYNKANHTIDVTHAQTAIIKNTVKVTYTHTDDQTSEVKTAESKDTNYVEFVDGNVGGGFSKSPSSTANALAVGNGALFNNDQYDSFIGTYSISGNVFEAAKDSGQGFELVDDQVWSRVGTTDAEAKKLTNEYYYSNISISMKDYTYLYPGESVEIAPDTANATGTATIYYQTASGEVTGPT